MVLARPPGPMGLRRRCWRNAASGGGGRAVSQSANVTTSSPDDQTQVLSVRGELDLATADGLYRQGRAAIGCRPRLPLLDLARPSFCDACGLTALFRTANAAQPA